MGTKGPKSLIEEAINLHTTLSSKEKKRALKWIKNNLRREEGLHNNKTIQELIETYQNVKD